jgi:DNA polymerase-3 subunit gamma/tau
VGFEMSVLRMLAFRPADGNAKAVEPVARAKPAVADNTRTAAAGQVATPAPGAIAPAAVAPPDTPSPLRPPGAATAAAVNIANADRWLELVAGSSLRGPARELAEHAGFLGHDNGVLRLSLSAADEHLKAPALVRMLAEGIAPTLGAAPQIRFETAQAATETLHQRRTQERDARQVAAEAAFMADPGVQRLISQHGASVVPDSIRPFDE